LGRRVERRRYLKLTLFEIELGGRAYLDLLHLGAVDAQRPRNSLTLPEPFLDIVLPIRDDQTNVPSELVGGELTAGNAGGEHLGGVGRWRGGVGEGERADSPGHELREP